MKKFAAIEGLRGWLAWAVVLDHLVQLSGVHASGLAPELLTLGSHAVMLFIIISGFVITHLVIEKPEPYGAYITRRFMRIFPLFALSCVAGFFTYDIIAVALAHASWAHDRTFLALAFWTSIASSDHAYLWQHILAHATMLHGAISDALLPHSQNALNGPAWSLSLEWQFYLVAPLIIAVVQGRKYLVWFASAFALCGIAYSVGWLGSFLNPGLLVAATAYFAVGIASRLVYSAIAGTVRHPSIILAMCIALIPLGWSVFTILVWVLVMSGLALDRSAPETGSFARIYKLTLESGAATYIGARSYSIYLFHLPIISICFALWLDKFPTSSSAASFFGVSAMSVPVILVVSDLLYRFVERPGIAFGSLVIQWTNRRRMRLPVATSLAASPTVML